MESDQLLERPVACAAELPLPRLLRRAGYACVAFSIFSTRLVLPYAWQPDLYIPVLSPLYRQQEHWLRRAGARPAVVVHVACGIAMLLGVVLQFDGGTRRRWPWLHRWVGRLYIAAGIGALISLRWLRDASGAGSAVVGDPMMAGFIDVASVSWLLATLRGLDAMVRLRDKCAHGRAMLLSASLAALPIFQRLINALFLVPLATALRCIVCLCRWGQSPWHARWGAPRGALSLLLDAPSDGDGAGALDPRASPRVYSLDGYGESEQAAFGLSAWLALLLVLSGAAVSAASSDAAGDRLESGVDESASGGSVLAEADESKAGEVDALVDGEADGQAGAGAGGGDDGTADGAATPMKRDARREGQVVGDQLLQLVALSEAATLGTWRRCATSTFDLWRGSRRLASRLGGVLCVCCGSRGAARMMAACAWPLVLVLPLLAAGILLAAFVVAIVAILIALPLAVATAATAVAALPYFALTSSKAVLAEPQTMSL